MYYQDIERIRSAGYKVEERNPWHYQVVGKTATVNIWPSKRKYMREYGGGADYYTDPVEAVRSIVGDAKTLRPRKSLFQMIVEEHERTVTSEMRKAYPLWRAGLLAFQKSITI